MKKEAAFAGMSPPHGMASLNEILADIPRKGSSCPDLADACPVLEIMQDISEKELKRTVERAGYQYVKVKGYAIYSPSEYCAGPLGIVLCT
ncbi:MAG: hypothetical protein ACQGQP_09815 [Desulfovibrio sp.]|jgi:hypothetical protein|nr:hypothetical protein [Mailhella sp.]